MSLVANTTVDLSDLVHPDNLRSFYCRANASLVYFKILQPLKSVYVHVHIHCV